MARKNAPVGDLGIEAEDSLFKLCQRYRQFTKKRYGSDPTDYILQKRWRRVLEDLIKGQLEGDQELFTQVFNWYLANASHSYVKDCQSLVLFCKYFRNIEKSMHRHEGTTPHQIPPKDEVIRHRIIKGTDSEKDDWE